MDRTLPYAATFALAAFGLLAFLAIVALASSVDLLTWLLLPFRRAPVGSPCERLQALPPTVRKQLSLYVVGGRLDVRRRHLPIPCQRADPPVPVAARRQSARWFLQTVGASR